MNLESYFISQFNTKHLGDDAAVIAGYVYSKDAFFEGVHYKREWLSCYQVAKKAMLVNLSDAIAMNATPKYALLSVAMPSDISRAEMRELARGFRDAADAYGVEIIGGDTISNTKLDITVTIISQTKRALYRSKIRNGYLFAYTGVLGRSAKDLKKLFNLGKIHQQSKFVNIQLRSEFIRKSERFLKAGMDISDGLLSDLEKLSQYNRIGVKFHKRVSRELACSGEEYEMLVAFDKRDKKKLQRHAQLTRTPLSVFAEASRKRYTNRCKSHHF